MHLQEAQNNHTHKLPQGHCKHHIRQALLLPLGRDQHHHRYRPRQHLPRIHHHSCLKHPVHFDRSRSRQQHQILLHLACFRRKPHKYSCKHKLNYPGHQNCMQPSQCINHSHRKGHPNQHLPSSHQNNFFQLQQFHMPHLKFHCYRQQKPHSYMHSGLNNCQHHCKRHQSRHHY